MRPIIGHFGQRDAIPKPDIRSCPRARSAIGWEAVIPSHAISGAAALMFSVGKRPGLLGPEVRRRVELSSVIAGRAIARQLHQTRIDGIAGLRFIDGRNLVVRYAINTIAQNHRGSGIRDGSMCSPVFKPLCNSLDRRSRARAKPRKGAGGSCVRSGNRGRRQESRECRERDHLQLRSPAGRMRRFWADHTSSSIN